jgi:hypothetical protein
MMVPKWKILAHYVARLLSVPVAAFASESRLALDWHQLGYVIFICICGMISEKKKLDGAWTDAPALLAA